MTPCGVKIVVMTGVTRPFRGVSAADRTSARRERLIEGFLDVVLAEGCSRATVNKICAEANLTKRYFYESFASLDDVMGAAAQRLFDRFFTEMVALTEGQPAGFDTFSAVVGAVFDQLESDPREARLYAECPGHPVLRDLRNEAVERFTTSFTATILDTLPELPSDVHLQVRVVVSGTTDIITGFLDGTIDTSREEIITAAGRLMTF